MSDTSSDAESSCGWTMISNEVQTLFSLFIITSTFICFSVVVIFKNLQSGEQLLCQCKEKRCDLNTISKLLWRIYTFFDPGNTLQIILELLGR